MRRTITWYTAICFLLTQTSVRADPHAEGVAAGQAANPVAGGNVNTTGASAVVPGYTSTPSESALYRQPNLSSLGSTRLATCATLPNDPVCQAQRNAMTSANLPRAGVSAYDPAVLAANSIIRSPSSVLRDLASYYAGCTTATALVPAGMQPRSCLRYVGVGEVTMRRDLTVQVELVPSCTAGDWFAHGQVNRNGSDYMVADAQCRIRADGLQHFRFYAAGGHGGCIGWQEVDLPTTGITTARFVAELSPHWSGSCWSPFNVVAMPGSGCTAGNCSYQFQFGPPAYACGTGSVSGDSLIGYWGGSDQPMPGPADQCYTLAGPDPEGICPPGTEAVDAGTGRQCATPVAAATLVGASGWTLPLSFQQPTMNQLETDTWDDHGASLAAGGRCTAVTPERCVDGPGTKLINGHPVNRACWSYERTVSCSGTAGQSDCAPLAAQGCTPDGTACRQTNPSSGVCEVFEDSYTCPTPAQQTTSTSNCPSSVFCFQGGCFDISRPPDADFGRSLSMLEAAREAGVYLDTNQMQVFKGEQNRCRDRLLKNCCYSDGTGAGMSNQSLFLAGSRLVYDVLMNAENQQFIYQGMSALLKSGGFSGTFTTYGVTVAVNGAALPAGSAVLYAGDSMVIAFDPWSLAVAVIIYIALSMMSCNEEEGKLAMKEGAKVCHSVGTWCSTCLMVLGVCASCTEHTTSKCCFNSMLARIINEQGRAQIAKGWGSSQSPDCSGFTVAQLQSLNFAAMDLSEFYASLVPALPNVGALQTNSAARLPTCYYGQGRCQ
jgi:conjugal transfer mating pair stabilization protein TraN